MHSHHPLAAALSRQIDLSAEERDAVAAVPVQELVLPSDQEILHEGERPSRCLLLREGLCCTSIVVDGGRRQITAFHIPGDLPDLHSLHLEVLDSDLWAVTACRLASMEHAPLRGLCASQPRIAAALWRLTVVDAAIFRQWMANLGQRPAINRIAHLFCEMMRRMEAAGRAQGGSCALPITQADLSDASGLSVVHVNRTLQELRHEGLIDFARGQLTIHDWDGLALLADFRPDYLHLPGRGGEAVRRPSRGGGGVAGPDRSALLSRPGAAAARRGPGRKSGHDG